MTGLYLVFAFIFGRVVLCLPAVIAFTTIYYLLFLESAFVEGLLYFLIVLTAIPITSCLILSCLLRYCSIKKPALSFYSLISVSSFAFLYESKIIGPLLLKSLDPTVGHLSAVEFIFLGNTVIATASAISLIFLTLLLIIELPFAIAFTVSSLQIPHIIKAARPAIILLLVSLSLEMIGQFYLNEFEPLFSLHGALNVR